MGGDHLQNLTQTNYFTRFDCFNGVFIDPHSSSWFDGFLASDDQTLTSSPSYISMDDDCSAGSLYNKSVKSQIYSSVAQIDQSSVRKSVSRQKTLKKSKTTMAKRKAQSVEKCEPDVKKKLRNETISSLSISNENKVSRQTMGDRIGRLQRLVSPLGKADTASVLSECIEYIKFLHEQVSVLCSTFTASNTSNIQHFQDLDECFNDQHVFDSSSIPTSLRSRGLCIVPVSSVIRHTLDITRTSGNIDL